MVKRSTLREKKVMALVYSDASSAILLYRAGLFEQTAEVFSLVLTHSVFKELNRDGYPGAELFRDMAASRQIQILPACPDLPSGQGMNGFSGMHKGERETIAQYLGPDTPLRSFILMDDGQGARFCHRHRIPFINALLVPKIFWYSGRMNETCARGKMETLTQLGRYSRQIISKAAALSQTDLAHFIPVKIK